MSENTKILYEAVFENSPIGLVLVNKDSTLRDVNQYMFRSFQMIGQVIEGRKFGNVFNCVAVSAQGAICGQTEICQSCGLRNGITAVLEEGITISNVATDHHFYINGTEQQKWFKISASRIVENEDTFAVVSFSDITTLKDYEALLNYQLTLDMATGVTNKYTLLNMLKTFVSNMECITVAMVDFDDFKNINDTYGHIVGDYVLKLFCSSASANSRRQDILGRFGGEEFMLIFPETFAGLTIDILKRISDSMRTDCEKELGFSPTFSVGLAEFSQQQMTELDVNAMIKETDTNLYEAKKRGKNMIFVGGVGIPFRTQRKVK